MLPALVLLLGLSQLGAEGSPQPSALALPKAHFVAQPGDPPWLVQVAQFHGHLGPSVVAGTRFGLAGLRAVGARGFFDVEVTCQGPFVKPPQSCFLDGLQLGTGATLGKRSINWLPADAIVVRVKNARSGKTAELRPTPQLLELLGSLNGAAKTAAAAQEDHEHGGRAQSPVESLARKIAAMSDAELVVVRVTKMPPLQGE
jgi:formylmethanofuran dehydrogenase subunit E